MTSSGMLLKFANDQDFMNHLCPTVNFNAVFTKKYNNSGAGFKGCFIAYWTEQSTNANTNEKKVKVTNTVDNLYLPSTYDYGFPINYSANVHYKDSTSVYHSLYGY